MIIVIFQQYPSPICGTVATKHLTDCSSRNMHPLRELYTTIHSTNSNDLNERQ